MSFLFGFAIACFVGSFAALVTFIAVAAAARRAERDERLIIDLRPRQKDMPCAWPTSHDDERTAQILNFRPRAD